MDRLRATRRRSDAMPPLRTPIHGVPAAHTGPLASAAWLAARALVPPAKSWSVEIGFRTGASRFELEIHAEEWGFSFHHDDRLSWIRVTDIAFVHGRDEHGLLGEPSALERIGGLITKLERRHQLAFSRADVAIRTTIVDAERTIRAWAAAL